VPIALRVRTTVFALAGLALAASTLLVPVAAAAPINPGLTKPAVKVHWESKQHLSSTTTYQYSVKNIGLRHASGIGTSGMCWYRTADGEEIGFNPHNASPSWINNGLAAGATATFTFSCKNTHNGWTLDHSTGTARAYFSPSSDEASDSDTSV
jgi:hypothetical protein